MTRSRWLRGCVAAVALTATGCTTLREIPRGQYTARTERENVRVVTRDGLVYDFEWIEVHGDSLQGFKRRDTAGRFEEVASLTMPVADVASMSRRSVDWTRTSIVGGGVIAAALLAGIGALPDEPGRSASSGGGQGRPPQ